MAGSDTALIAVGVARPAAHGHGGEQHGHSTPGITREQVGAGREGEGDRDEAAGKACGHGLDQCAVGLGLLGPADDAADPGATADGSLIALVSGQWHAGVDLSPVSSVRFAADTPRTSPSAPARRSSVR